MNVLKTIKTNWRDVVIGIALTLGLALGADVLERIATTDDGKVWLTNVVTSLRGLAAFAGANLAAFFMIAVAWPTLNQYSNDSFSFGWNSLSNSQRFLAFLAVAIGYLMAAALCFAP
jgi:hypothetical protein